MSISKQTAKFISRIAENLPDMDENVMQGWIDNPKGLGKVLSEALCPPKLVAKAISYIVAVFTAMVDETVSVEDAVKAGKFDWSNDNITSANFPKLANGQKSDKEITLFHFNKTMTSEVVIAEMDKAGYRPANIWELIGLAIKEPDLQRKFPIVALGSVCELVGNRHVPCLCEGSSLRVLSLDYFDNDWNDRCRFAGVCK